VNRIILSVCSSLALTVTLFAAQAHAQSPSAQAPSPVPSGHADGVRTFSTYCSGCHGTDGRGGERAPNIATTRNIVAMSDDDLEAIVKRGVSGSGMPAFGFLGDQTIKNVVAHLRDLQGKNSAAKINGNPEAGHVLFFGRAGCSQCHMVRGEGGFIGTDLTDYANGIAPDAVSNAITKPDAVLAPTSTVVEVVLANGQQVSGLARAEDNFTITLQTNDGRWHTFDKSRLKELDRTDRSFHPRDYATRLSSKELDDLVSYLMVSAAGATPKPNHRRNP